jgi:hypothetical protein
MNNSIKQNNIIRAVSSDYIFEKYKTIFKTELDEMSKCNICKHRIVTKGSPVVQKNYQIPKLWEAEIDEQVKSLLKSKIISPSKSQWASRIILVRKRTGELRLCIDFRNVNEVTEYEEYPIPRIDEILDELSQASIFSILDATSGYYQIEIEENDRPKTAFRWKTGFYEFNRMPFGLCNAPATFQMTMDTIFKDVNGMFVIPYLDDIIVFSKNKDEHLLHLDCVMEKIKRGLVLNRKKCKLFKDELEILGNVVSQG